MYFLPSMMLLSSIAPIWIYITPWCYIYWSNGRLYMQPHAIKLTNKYLFIILVFIMIVILDCWLSMLMDWLFTAVDLGMHDTTGHYSTQACLFLCICKQHSLYMSYICKHSVLCTWLFPNILYNDCCASPSGPCREGGIPSHPTWSMAII